MRVANFLDKGQTLHHASSPRERNEGDERLNVAYGTKLIGSKLTTRDEVRIVMA